MNKNFGRADPSADLSQRSLDFHCHGVGKFDFTEIENLNLDEIDSILPSKA